MQKLHGLIAPSVASEGLIPRKIIMYYIVYFLLLITCCGVSTYNLNRYKTDADWVIHTRAVECEAWQMYVDVLDGERSAANFLFTGTESYLVPYGEVAEKLNDKAQQFLIMTNDNANQGERIKQLSTLVNIRLARLDLLIQTRREQGAEAVRALVNTGEGRKQTETIKKTLEGMIEEEQDLLITRQARMIASAAMAAGSLVALFAFASMSLGCLYWQVRKAMIERLTEKEQRHRAREAILEKVDGLSSALQGTGNRTLAEILEDAGAFLDPIRTLTNGLVPENGPDATRPRK